MSLHCGQLEVTLPIDDSLEGTYGRVNFTLNSLQVHHLQ